MKEEEIEIEKILEGIRVGVYFVDKDRRILYWNHGAERITGFKSEEIVGKRCPETPLRHMDDYGINLCEGYCPLVEAMEKNAEVEKRVWVHTKNGVVKNILVKTVPVYDNKGNIVGAVETFEDLSYVVKLEKAIKVLKSLVSKDPLTKLYNKNELYIQLNKFIEEVKRGKNCIVIFIDIDDFKLINDKCGHEEGDKIIKQVSKVLSKSLRAKDWIFRPISARFGGDEFVMLIEIGQEITKKIVEDIAKRLLNRVKDIESCVGKITCSIGVTKIKADDEAEEIIKRADELMYRAKESKVNKICTDIK